MRVVTRRTVTPMLLVFILFLGCSSSTTDSKNRLLGKWTDGSNTAEFKDDGSVWVEQRTTDMGNFISLHGQSFKFCARSSGADLEGKGTATFLEDGRIHLKVVIETQDPYQPNKPTAKRQTTVDALLEKISVKGTVKALPLEPESKNGEPTPADLTKQPSSVSVAPALTSWEQFLDIAGKCYDDRVVGKYGDHRDGEVIEFAGEFRGKTVYWTGTYLGLETTEKDRQVMQVKLDMPRRLTPPLVTTFRCTASDGEKWSDVAKGSSVRFSGKVVQVGTAWVKMKLSPFGGEKRVQVMALEVTSVCPMADKGSPQSPKETRPE